MNSREVVVRIIQPLEQPAPPKPVQRPNAPKKTEKNLFQIILNTLGLAAIAALGIFLVVSFFNLGVSLKDIVILVSIPLTVSLVASYAVF